MSKPEPDTHEVRAFVEKYVAQARAATAKIKKPGVLQMILVHPNNKDKDDCTPYRYALNDKRLAERMTTDAINASKNGHNIYVEGRTVRPGLRVSNAARSTIPSPCSR